MVKNLRALIVEDSEDDTLLDVRQLEREGYKVDFVRVDSEEELAKALNEREWDVVLSDYTLPRFSGIESLELVRRKFKHLPFIFVSGTLGEDKAVEAMRNGASDYVLKNNLNRLAPAVARELREVELRRKSDKAEKDLIESERRFRLLAEAAREALVFHDNGILLQANDQFFKLFGYEPKELIRQYFIPVTVPPESVDVVSKMVQEKSLDTYEAMGIKKDGTKFPVEVRARYINVDGRDIRVATILDISERKIAVDTIRAAVQRLSLATELSGIGIVEVNLLRKEATCDAKASKVLGIHTNHKLTLEEMRQLVSPDDFKRAADLLRHVLSKKKPGSIELDIRHQDGTMSNIEGAIGLIDKGTSETVSAVCVILDVTSRYQAIEKIRQQAALLDASHDAISVLDLGGGIVFWNKGAEELYGWKASEIGDLNQPFTPPDDTVGASNVGGGSINAAGNGIALTGEMERAALSSTLAEGRWEGELHQKTRSGKEIVILSRWTLIRDKDDMPRSILVISTDITEQKALELQYRRSQRMEILGKLAGGIAHDFSNLLTPIGISLDALRKKHARDESTLRVLSLLDSTVSKGSGVLKQILAFARGSETQRELIDPSVELEDIKRMVDNTFPRTITSNVNVEKGCWLFLADKTQVHQVLMNLCINARDAMPKGGDLTIRATSITIDRHYAALSGGAKVGHYVALEVSDTGAGIKKENLYKIFDPFFTTKEQGKGTGLGLSIVQGIIDSHGGFIEVDSEMNKGTTFKVYFPSVESEEPAATTVQEGNPEQGHGELLLIADNDPAIREITESTLKAYGYKVLLASDGSEAVALLAKHIDKVKLAITDMILPIMDGAATIWALRKLNPDLEIIATTTFMDDIRNYDSLETTVSVLRKPYTARKLLNSISQSLGHAKNGG